MSDRTSSVAHRPRLGSASLNLSPSHRELIAKFRLLTSDIGPIPEGGQSDGYDADDEIGEVKFAPCPKCHENRQTGMVRRCQKCELNAVGLVPEPCPFGSKMCDKEFRAVGHYFVKHREGDRCDIDYAKGRKPKAL